MLDNIANDCNSFQNRYTSPSALSHQFVQRISSSRSPMPLEHDQIGRLLAAGNISIPCIPDSGLISVELDGMPMPDDRAQSSVKVAHYSSPTQKTTYILALSSIRAIFLPWGLDAAKEPMWIVGNQLASDHQRMKDLAAASPVKGTVFVPEDNGVIMSVETAVTAGDIGALPRSCI